MLSMHCVVLVLAVVPTLDAVIFSHDPVHGISPALEPKSDKTFFKKDYPSDLMPRAGKHYVFDHPYPAVQDTADFDRDYVKDENSDHGHWKAHMDYDILRTKIREAEKRVAEARADLGKHDAAWHKASVDYTEAAKSEEVTEDEMKHLEQTASEADAKVEELEGSASAHGDAKVGGAVGGAVDEVNKEMKDLDECKKNLAETKQRLKDLLKEKEEHQHKEKQDKAAKEEADKLAKEKADETSKQEMTEKQKHTEDAQIRNNEKELSEEEVEARTQAEAGWKKKITEEQKATSKAARSYDEELADVKKTEAELNQAAENLRKYRRRPHVDDDGGVYYKKDKSAAALSTVSPVLLLLVTAIAITG